MLRIWMYFEVCTSKKANKINVFARFARFVSLWISRFQVQLLMGASFMMFNVYSIFVRFFFAETNPDKSSLRHF